MAQIPDDLFDMNRVASPQYVETGYEKRLGSWSQRISEILRIGEVPRGLLVSIAVLLIVAMVLGAFAMRSCGEPGLHISRGEGSSSNLATQEQQSAGSEAVDEAVQQDVVVYVAGSVALPGVYYLPSGSRVCDAIEAAGGLLDDADLYTLNLASPLSDSQKVYVPAISDTVTMSSQTENVTNSNGLININVASEEQLQGLVGIGPSLARAIVEDRNTNGPFLDVTDLTRVPGIGEKTFSRFASSICI